MHRREEWKLFIKQLQESALQEYYSTPEYTLHKIRQAQLDDLLTNELTADQKSFVEEIVSEIIALHDREADLLYRQGIKDGVWMLKILAQ